jgi:hypothetical protein
MLKTLWLLAFLCYLLAGRAQSVLSKKINKNQFRDSIVKENDADDLPVIAFNEHERIPSHASLPSILSANRDVLLTTAGFHFNIARFRLRGYDATSFSTEINGIPMNSPEDGATPYSLWSGLNDVMRNTQSSLGLRATDFAFGSIGNTTTIDTRASKQRVQTQFGYTFSNRSFTNRFHFTHSSGMNKKGWAYTVSGNVRYASEGYVAGTFYDGKSYFMAIDKKMDDRNMLSFTLFGAPLTTGKQSPVLEESSRLAQTPYYNAYWGYQAGKKRNANTRSTNQPVIMFRYDRQIDNHTAWTTSIGFVFGERADTGLDWYKAADPRPDYYRYLPSYQKDPLLQASVREAIQANKNLLQINWDHLVEVNRNSYETITNADGGIGNIVSGKRAHYIVEERMLAYRRFAANSVYHSLLTDKVSFATGISFQSQRTHQYKRVNDLLGGDFYVDWNQFAERDFPNDPLVLQNDLNRPNRILKQGDAFGYDYLVHSLLTKGWLQIITTGRKFDHFSAAEISYTNYQREGLVTNGLFPDNSPGRSFLNEFTGYSFKTGITYKINGRKYLYAHAGYFVKAPLFDNVFISPKTRDNQQENSQTEKILSTEFGYIYNTQVIKLRTSGYFTCFSNGMNITSFYHDGYGNFVNYALSGINKIHFGVESGADIKLSERFSITIAASAGRYYYNSRQQVTVSADNDASVIERGLIYSKNFRVGGTPQEAYGMGVNYQSSGFYCSLTGSYFRQEWLEFNPLRRTYAALQGIAPESDQWKQITGQIVLPDQYTVDLSAGSSIKLKLFHSKKAQLLLLNTSINNLLNKRNIISGGYEQLRFDMDTKNISKFPPKFFYAMGLNFSININLRL